MSMTRFEKTLLLIACSLFFSFSARSEDEQPLILITNANVFDGVNETLETDADVLIEGNLIKKIGRNIEAPPGARVIDATGRTMIPGLIDTHWHMTMAEIPRSAILFRDIYEVAFDVSANPLAQKKWIAVTDASNTIYPLAKKVGVNIAFGTDLLMDKDLAAKQGKLMAKMDNWFDGYEALKIATSENAGLLALSGPRNPYQAGPLGVLKEGAYADLIIVDGNPLEDLQLVADPGNNFDLIIKDGNV